MISINIYEIVMQMINFLILVWLLNRFVYKPVLNFLNKRETRIKTDLEEAQTHKTEAEKLLENQKNELHQAKLEAREIRKKAEEAGQREKESLVKEAKNESLRLAESAKKELDLNVARAKEELVSHSARLTIQLSEKVLQDSLSDTAKKDLLANKYQELISKP